MNKLSVICLLGLLMVGCAKDPSDADDAGMDGGTECPPECFRAFECATSCDAQPFNNGCCACPEGTIDVITCDQCQDAAPECPTSFTARCDIPCSGVAPDPEVADDCRALTTQEACTTYQSMSFPSHCVWLSEDPGPCLAP